MLAKREKKGSRIRCIQLTDLPQNQVAKKLTELVTPYAVIEPEQHHWQPRGLMDPSEIDLGKASTFLSEQQRQELVSWWFTVHQKAFRTPNWDIISSCQIQGRPGLLLVEAKAHIGEFSKQGKTLKLNASENGVRNHTQIGMALNQADKGLQIAFPGVWNLDRDKSYQLSNRFAWAWKLASLKIPVVLVYLGFLNAHEMAETGCKLFSSYDSWEKLVHTHAMGVIPNDVWGQVIDVQGTPFVPLIRSAEIKIGIEINK